MIFDLGAALAGAVLCGAGGLAVPAMIRALPEPPPPETDAHPDEPPKQPYPDIAATPGLTLRSVLLSGAVGGLLCGVIGPFWGLLLVLPQVPVGVALSIIDWRTRLLPTRLVLPATALALVAGGIVTLVAGSGQSFVRGLIGLVVTRSLFWLAWFVRSAGMGFGDVRLSALLGFVLAFLGWGPLVVGLYAAFLAFGLPGLLLAAIRRDASVLKRGYPFGPFLYVGAVVGICVGGQVMARLVGG